MAFEAQGKLYQFKRVPFGVTNGICVFQRTIDWIIQEEKLSDSFAYVDNIAICGTMKAEHDKSPQAVYDTAKKYIITFNHHKSITVVTKLTLLGYTMSQMHISPDCECLRPLLEMPAPTTHIAQKRVVSMFSYYGKFINNFSEKICVFESKF